MNSPLTRFRRFLPFHSFYPLILSTLMAGAFFAFRVFYSGTKNYSNLLWNLFLAWLPYIVSIMASYTYINNRKHWIIILLLGIVWLVFFPNAPYMATVFITWNPRHPER